jgi:hypothetical protein
LAHPDVAEFQQIMRDECGVVLDDTEAWNRATELVTLYRTLLGPIPEDPERAASSNMVPPGPSCLESGKKATLISP